MIVIAEDAVADAVREAVQEVTAVATPAAADAEDGRIAWARALLHSLRKKLT